MQMRVNVSNGIEFSWNYDDMPKLTIRTFFDEMERQMGVDLTGFVIMCIDVWYGKGSNSGYFTRCGVEVQDFCVMNWSKSLGPIHDGSGDETTVDADIRIWDPKARKNIVVEFMDVTFSDINDMINWLRLQKNVFYTPPKDGKYELVPKAELECLKKEHKNKVDAQQKELRKYQNFFDAVCDELDTTESDPEKVLEELSDDLERLDDLEDLRSEICRALDIDNKIGSYRQNNKRILEQLKELKKMEYEHYHVTHDWVKVTALEEALNDLCDENNVVRPLSTRNYKERLEYIFEVLTNWRKRAVRAEHEHDECIKANTKDYANAKVARAELANLYKRILGEERLDPKLSPHEVAVAIIKHVQGLCDLQHEANMKVKELEKFRDEVYNALNLGYPTTNNHILTVLRTRLEKLDADGPWVAERYITELIRENSTKFKVLQPLNYMTIEERMRHTFEVLNEWRDRALKLENEMDQICEAFGTTPADTDVNGLLDIIADLKTDRGDKYILQRKVKELEKKLSGKDFYVEGIDAAEYRAFVMKLFEVVGKPVVEEIISTQYLAKMVLEEVKDKVKLLEQRDNELRTISGAVGLDWDFCDSDDVVDEIEALLKKIDDIHDICEK